MGFWDSAGKLAMKAGSFALEEAKKSSERSREYAEEMPNKTDSQLVSIVKNERSSSPIKAGAAFKELKSRGYDAEDIKRMMS